ncbi:MAG TPA: hypothetical protein VK611_04025 [Acidimicrobiales bacterium]|nr:hypothetical protein [Acidimicrobiales bacterium]
MRTRTLLGVLTVLAALAGGIVWSAPPAAAACRPTVVYLPPDYKPTVVCIEIEDPGDTPGDPGDDGDEGGGEPDPNGCHWEPYPIPPGVVPDRPGDASPGATMWWEICTNEFGVDYVGPGGTAWFEPDEAPLPSPEQVATEFRVEIASRLRKPTLDADPAAGTPSLLDVPTFVAVSNWQGEQTAGGCDPTGTVCVELVATPTLTFDPGETGAAAVTCEDGGTRYDPGGPAPREQAAAPGACAHTYTQRTGAAGRPAAWPGTVTVTWAVHWQQPGGVDGDFPAIALSDDLPREVEEVQGVISGLRDT